MKPTYQYGYLRRTRRKVGPDRWEYLWRETDATGDRIRRTTIVGTVEQYPNEEDALAAVNGLRMKINSDLYRQRSSKAITVGGLIDHYIQTELSPEASWHSLATRINYRYFLGKWIRPRWREHTLYSIHTVSVEHWLRTLNAENGEPLANATKAKIRNIFSVIFNHAIRYEWLEQGRNPIRLVRQSAKRRRAPTILEIAEIQALLGQLTGQFRLMVVLAATTGLRRSELFGLKWSDVDFVGLEISIRRSIYLGKVGICKTETSHQPVPMTDGVAADLWLWKESTRYREPDHWIFPSKRGKGRKPLWPGTVLDKVIRPAALRAGISKRLGWHTFRHTYSTLLIDNGGKREGRAGADAHASSHFTLQTYSQAQIRTKRAAQRRVVEALLPWEHPDSASSPSDTPSALSL